MGLKSLRFVAALLVCETLVVPTVLAQTSKNRGEHGMNKKTEEAFQLFRNGQYEKAAEFFKALLKKNPDDKQAQLGLARCYYHQENWSDALLQFRKTNLENLDPEASYEYAQTFFHYELYSSALKGFRRVPRDNSLYGLAQYFGGIAALKLKRYKEAQDLMEGAVNLPEAYQLQKEVYQRHIQLLVLRQQKRELAKEASAADTAAPPSSDGGENAPKPYVYMGFFDLYKDALIGVRNESEKLEFGSGKKTSNSRSVRYFTFENGIIHPLQQEGDRRHVVGFQLFLYADHKDNETLQRSDYLDRPDVLGRTKEFTKTGRAAIKVFSELALPNYFLLGLQAGFFQEYPDFGKKLAFSSQHGELWFGQKKYEDGYEARMRARLTQTRDPDGLVSINEQAFTIESEKEILENVELSLFAQRTEFFYKKAGINGPDTRMRGDVVLEFKLPYHFELELKGRYQKEINSTLYNIANQSEVRYDAGSGRGEAELIFYPLRWIELSARIAEEKKWLEKGTGTTAAVFTAIQDREFARIQETGLQAAINLLF